MYIKISPTFYLCHINHFQLLFIKSIKAIFFFKINFYCQLLYPVSLPFLITTGSTKSNIIMKYTYILSFVPLLRL